ncbi:MAG: 50S ribosomal protein L29 [Candidatus Gottesmanbacteria bacterium]|nr:50S ribosomal protein L29 [Candidatus Gottesmanbacteria bacterium]
MKAKEQTALKAMTEKELVKVLVDAKTALAILTINRYTKQSKNVHEAGVLRHKIALVSTLLRQKELIHE